MIVISEKACPKCGGHRRYSRGGQLGDCTACAVARAKKYANDHPEKSVEWWQEFYRNNPLVRSANIGVRREFDPSELKVSEFGKLYVEWTWRGKPMRRYLRELKCDTCNAPILCDNNKRTKRHFCRQCRSVGMSGPNSTNWVGGRKFKRGRKGGHVLIYAPDHPFAKQKYIPEHRAVVEKREGRILPREIDVHHLNMDPQDNADENLMPMTNRQHRLAHGSLNKLVKPLMLAGLISFNKATLKYELGEKSCSYLVSIPA